MSELRVVCYLNQFFGQIGGEDKAGVGPQVFPGAVGAARAVQQALGDVGRVVATVVAGDNYVAERADALSRRFRHHRRRTAGLIVAGLPSSRGAMASRSAPSARTRRPARRAPVTGMPRRTRVELYRRASSSPHGGDAARMLDEVRRSSRSAQARATEPSARPVEVFPRGITRIPARHRAQRARDGDAARQARGRRATSEGRCQLPPHRGPPAVRDLRHAVIALVTDGGIVPLGNPDGIEALAATRFGAYSIEGRGGLDPGQYDNVHRGYDTSFVKQDPHRLVPVDVARELEQEGAIGKLHETVYSTTGVATTLAHSERMGREIAAKLRAARVDAVILTST